MSTISWIIVAVVVIGVLWFVLKRKKGGQKPEGPQAPPTSQPPQM